MNWGFPHPEATENRKAPDLIMVGEENERFDFDEIAAINDRFFCLPVSDNRTTESVISRNSNTAAIIHKITAGPSKSINHICASMDTLFMICADPGGVYHVSNKGKAGFMPFQGTGIDVAAHICASRKGDTFSVYCGSTKKVIRFDTRTHAKLKEFNFAASAPQHIYRMKSDGKDGLYVYWRGEHAIYWINDEVPNVIPLPEHPGRPLNIALHDFEPLDGGHFAISYEQAPGAHLFKCDEGISIPITNFGQGHYGNFCSNPKGELFAHVFNKPELHKFSGLRYIRDEQ